MSLPVYNLRRAAPQDARVLEKCVSAFHISLSKSNEAVLQLDLQTGHAMSVCCWTRYLRMHASCKTSLQFGHCTHEGSLLRANDISSKHIGHAWTVSSAFGRIALHL
eukprot:4965590-Prymnesium_polylepis.2